MPYRHAGQGLCAVCNCFTEGKSCPRCGRDLCALHLPRLDDRCGECEAEFVQVQTLVRGSMSMGVLALRVLAVAASCLLLVLVGQLDVFSEIGPYISLAGGLMVCAFLAALAVIGHRRRSLRARFLAEGQVAAPVQWTNPSIPSVPCRW